MNRAFGGAWSSILRVFACAGASACLVAPSWGDGIDVGRNAAGKLLAIIEVPQPLPIPNSPFPGIEGYATADVGFSSVEHDHPAEGLFALPPTANVEFVLLGAEHDLLVFNGLTPMMVGEAGLLGTPFFDVHPVYNIDHGGPGTTKSLQFVLRDLSGQFAESDPFTLSFVATPACPGDIDGDGNVGLGDVAQIIACWAEEDHCNHEADLDHSHDIGLGDLAVVIQFWSTTCP